MRSEMREFGALDVENLRSLREVVAGTEHWAKVVSLDRAIALLARTEAGADRPVAEISELSGAKLIVLYSADEIGHLPKGTKLYAHPQDASGDAEDARRYRWARDHVGGTAWNDDNFATVTIGVTVPKPRGTCAFDVTAEMLDAAIDAAMQAKEAK